MEEHLREIEKIFLSTDFSKESNLMTELRKKLFTQRELSLNELMAEEGVNSKKERAEKSARKNLNGTPERENNVKKIRKPKNLQR